MCPPDMCDYTTSVEVTNVTFQQFVIHLKEEQRSS